MSQILAWCFYVLWTGKEKTNMVHHEGASYRKHEKAFARTAVVRRVG